MLPTYISLRLGTQEESYHDQPAAKRAWKAQCLGLLATAGFLVMLALVGAVLAADGQWLIRVLRWAPSCPLSRVPGPKASRPPSTRYEKPGNS